MTLELLLRLVSIETWPVLSLVSGGAAGTGDTPKHCSTWSWAETQTNRFSWNHWELVKTADLKTDAPPGTPHLAFGLRAPLLVWFWGQLGVRGQTLRSSVYGCLRRRFQQSEGLRFRTPASDALADRERGQGVGQAVWGLHGGRGGGEGGVTGCRGGKNRGKERTRKGDWENRKKERKRQHFNKYSFVWWNRHRII